MTRGLAASLLAVALLASAVDGAPRPESTPVAAMGLFPIGSGAQALSLVFESIEVTPSPTGCAVRRQYKIRCRGGGGRYRLGIALIGGGGTPSGLDSTIAMSLDGVPQDLQLYEGRLVLGGRDVLDESLTEAELKACAEARTGTICKHTWAELEMPISRNGVRVVDVYYRQSGTSREAAAFAETQLGLYTERFWGGNKIPRIDARLELASAGDTMKSLRPAAALVGEGIVDSRYEGSAMIWRIRNYRLRSAAPDGPDFFAVVVPVGDPP